MVKVRYEEFRKARKIMSYLSYYWEVVGKNHSASYSRFSGLMDEFYSGQLEEVYGAIRRGPLSKTVKLTLEQANTLEQLVILTNTLERLSKKRRRDDESTK